MARNAKALAENDGAAVKQQLTKEQQDEIWGRNADERLGLEHELDDARAIVAGVNGKISAWKKRAKHDGVDTDAIVVAIKLKKRDPEEVIAEHKSVLRVLHLLDAPLGKQFDLLRDVEVKDVVEPRTAGKAAGKNGEGADNNPYQSGTEQYQQWETGRMEGQAVIANRMRPAGAPKARTAGRAPKGAAASDDHAAAVN